MNMNEPPSLLRNDLGAGRGGRASALHTGNGWLHVRLEGTSSNRTGLGATVRVTSGGRTQARAVLSQSSYYSHDDLRLPFGLGSASRVERIEVRWPSGQQEVVTDVPANQLIVIREGQGQVTGGLPARRRSQLN